ncbi:MAG: cell division protein FtsL [SAR324 cluster bacterium]|nr:cell division protein FtsL [SAR324 cluster bacterium]MBL7034513.1 cell division protein FtsL [SAR324 cluster bacterium]
MSLRSIVHSAKRKPLSLKHQYRWKLVPRFIWQSMQSFHITLVVWALVTVGCIFYLSQWMNYRQVAHRVDSLEIKHTKLTSQLELLEVEISYLTRPQRLELLAKQIMSMSAPDPVQYRLSWVDVSNAE